MRHASAWTRPAMRFSPSGPWYTAYIDATTASSTCAVQMLLVAFSRLMCCSRVCSASRSATCPASSLDTPTRRPGSERAFAALRRDEPGVRAAEAERDAEPLCRSDDDVRALLARGSDEAAGEEVGRDHEERADVLRVASERA